MIIKIKNWLIKVGVNGLVKAGRADEAKQLCKDIIDEIDKRA